MNCLYQVQNLTQICRILNDEKVPTPLEYKNQRKKQNRKELQQEHKYWQPGTVRAILTNESYLGSMVYNKSVQAEVGASRVILKPREEWKVFENHHSAIISKEEFDKVQEKFFCKKAVVRKPIQYALKGKVYCGYCHRRLRIMKLAGGRLFYYCPNQKLNSNNECLSGSVSNELLEKIVLEEIRAQITRLADLASSRRKATERQRTIIGKMDKERMSIEALITGLTESKAGLLEAYHVGTYTEEQYMEYRRQLDQQISENRIWQKKLKKQSDICNDSLYADTGNYGNLLQYAGFETLTKEMVDAFIDWIDISRAKVIDIRWTFNKEVGSVEVV